MPAVTSLAAAGRARKARALWQNEQRHTPSLGCRACPEFGLCGGLQVAAQLFSCLDLCQCSPGGCSSDAVCRRSAVNFARHFREVGGFDLENLPELATVSAPDLPIVAPVIFHGRRRIGGFRPSAAAMSFYDVIASKNGAPRFSSGAALRAAFGLASDVPLVLSGIAKDPMIERWWSYEAPRRRQAIAELRAMAGQILVTVPNFSLFRDVPRWDNLHAMKRIAIAWWEFVDGGVPAALHLNARTERDYERWARFVAARPEVTHVAFEFGTSAGQPGRREWHVAQLVAFAKSIGRPVHLVVKGGIPVFEHLSSAFPLITLLDTSAFMKAMMRIRLTPIGNVRLSDVSALTMLGAPLDDILDANVRAVQDVVAFTAAPPLTGRSRA